LDEVDSAGAGEGMVQALAGGAQVAHAESGLAMEPGGADEVAFLSQDVCQLPGALRQRQRLAGLTEPEAALREIGVNGAFALFAFSCDKDMQRTAKGNR
jgi:hypothetical protein